MGASIRGFVDVCELVFTDSRIGIAIVKAGMRSLLLCLAAGLTPITSADTCMGEISVGEDATVQIIRNNHSSPGGAFYYSGPVTVSGDSVSPGMDDEVKSGSRDGGRAYFGKSCTEGEYHETDYVAWQLLDKSLSYTVDLSTAGCGCNAALYLVSMAQNSDKSTCDDYYCDANSVCGVMCAEIDIQEANTKAWHSTAHVAADPGGAVVGYGGGGDEWSGPRDFTSKEYGPTGSTINSQQPFDVRVSFPTDDSGTLSAIDFELSQEGRTLPFSITGYDWEGASGFKELTAALSAGMTPVVSYWCSDDMLWMDGVGNDGLGPCSTDEPAKCGSNVTFSNIVFADDDADDAAPAVDDDDESTPSNHCSEDNDCNTCFSCCKDYLSDQDSCDGCVTEMC